MALIIRPDAYPATSPPPNIDFTCLFLLFPVASKIVKTPEAVRGRDELHDLQTVPLASDADVPVLVLADGRLVLHHGGVGIIRTLGRMGVPVYSVVKDRFTPAAVSRYLTGAFIWQTRGLDAQRFLEGMDVIRRRLSRPAIVIPTDDLAAIFIAEHAAALQPQFLFPQQPPMLPALWPTKENHICCAEELEYRARIPCFRALPATCTSS